MESINLGNISDEEIRRWNLEIKEYNKIHEVASELDKADDTTKVSIVNVANYLLELASSNEPQITNDLEEIICNESYLVEKEHRLKGRKRLEEKIYHKMLEDNSDFMIVANKIYDTVRYTVIVDFDNYIALVDKYLHDLEDYGYTVDKVKNRWNDIYCKGISVLLRNQSGVKFEIQFHTRENYDSKEVLSREPYNLTRRNNVPLNLLFKASLLRKLYHSKVRVPKGALEYEFKSNNKKNK